ncbi:MAG: hypothetical protein J0L93_08395 [Deltaproteobacteria bacterium]|nr:hypothetical protein [Deltaproteobacteria bacterium]
MKKLISKISGFKNLAGVLFVATIIWGCGSDNNRLRERAQIEGEESAKMAVEAENTNREKRVSEMESDLQRRQQVYHALKGTYQGPDNKGYESRFVLTPSLPFYKPNRVRTVEEVTNDLTNLFITIEVSFWDPTDSLNRYSCHFQTVRPDLETGRMYLSTEGCPFSFAVFMGDLNVDPNNETPASSSSQVVKSVLAGVNTKISQIHIEERSRNTPDVIQFSLDRKGP